MLMKKTLTRSLLLCVLFVSTLSLKAEPVRKPAEKKLHQHEAEADSDRDEPAPKKPKKHQEAVKEKDDAAPPSASHPAAVSSLNPDDIAGFDGYPKQVRSLVESSLALTHLGLTYTFGGSNPSEGGMDCSGTIYHVLRFQGLKDVPRQSDEMCAWVRDHSQLHLTPTAKALDDAEFAALRPGDLVFWTGTYKTDRKLPVTHVMLYLGKLKASGKPVVFGASDGRFYAGERRSGISVFDFTLPREGSEAALYGYGPAPGLQPPHVEFTKADAGPPPITAGETILPAIVVPPHSPPMEPIATHKTDDEEPPVARKKTNSDMADTPPSSPKKKVHVTSSDDDSDKPAAVKKKAKSEVVETPPSTLKKKSHDSASDDDTDKPDAVKKKAKPEVAETPPSTLKKKSHDSSSDDDSDKPAAVKHKPDADAGAKSTEDKKTPSSATAHNAPRKRKPPPSPGRVALDETQEALQRAAKSIRSAFE